MQSTMRSTRRRKEDEVLLLKRSSFMRERWRKNLEGMKKKKDGREKETEKKHLRLLHMIYNPRLITKHNFFWCQANEKRGQGIVDSKRGMWNVRSTERERETERKKAVTARDQKWKNRIVWLAWEPAMHGKKEELKAKMREEKKNEWNRMKKSKKLGRKEV